MNALRRRLRLVPVLFVLGCTGCTYLPDLPQIIATDPAPPAPPAEPRYLALGDSYTIGQSVDPTLRWSTWLAHALPTADPTIIARTGWTVANLDAAMDRAELDGPYALVTLLIGVNDQFQGGTPEAYRPAFRAILRRAIGLAGGPCRVVVLSIPDYGNTPFGHGRAEMIGAAIDAFNSVNREESASAGVAYVSVTEISREPDAALVAADGLHPSGAQYLRWADVALPAARAALACD